MILVIYGIEKYCSQNVRLSQKNARDSEMNAQVKITQVVTLVNDKMKYIFGSKRCFRQWNIFSGVKDVFGSKRYEGR